MAEHVHVRAEAHADVVSIYQHIRRDSRQAAEQFLDALDEAYNRIARYPRIGHRWEGEYDLNVELRIVHIAGFPNHLIFYLPLQSGD